MELSRKRLFTAAASFGVATAAAGLLKVEAAPATLAAPPALIAAYRWVLLTLGGLSACAAVVAWSIPDLDLAASPFGALASSTLHGHRQIAGTRPLKED